MSNICPKCSKVFENNITTCPDCQTELIAAPEKNNGAAENQEVKQVSVFSLTSEDSAQRVIEYMKEQGVTGEYRYSLREKTFKIYVAQPDARNALRACTAFYAVEAKRLKAEEDKRREEEEAKRRAEEEEKRRIEEEARRKREEEEARRRAEEEKERLRREAEEAARKKAEEEAIRKAENEAKMKALEAERVRLEAEEAIRKAEEAAKALEEEAKRAAEEEERRKKQAEEEAKRKAEEEAKRKVEEEQKRIEEEKEKKRLESERRRKLFEESIREAEAQRQEERKKKFTYIPHVEGEPVPEETGSAPAAENIEPEEGPIFVETEPVDEYAVGDTIVVDAVEVEATDNAAEDTPVSEEETDSSAFDDFFAGIKTSKNISSSFFGSSDEEDEEAEESPAEEAEPLFAGTPIKPQKPLVEDIFADNVFSEAEKKPEEKTEEKNAENSALFEEVINKDLKESSSAEKAPVKSKFASKFEAMDDLDGAAYKGFIPDYHEAEETEDEDEIIAKQYGFDPGEYKRLKEMTAKRSHERKNNPQPKSRPQNKDFTVIDDSELDDYKGFVPDYSARRDEEKMQYYTKRTSIDYSKYRTASEGTERNTLADLNATLRSSSQTELSRLFENDVLKTAVKPQDYIGLKSSTYLLALTGGQLNSLFTSWLMTNCTAATVRQYAKDGASSDENYNNKIEGIKNLLRQNFGKLDDAVLDIIVKKFYNKYLDE